MTGRWANSNIPGWGNCEGREKHTRTRTHTHVHTLTHWHECLKSSYLKFKSGAIFFPQLSAGEVRWGSDPCRWAAWPLYSSRVNSTFFSSGTFKSEVTTAEDVSITGVFSLLQSPALSRVVGVGEIYDRPQTHYGTKGAVNYGSKYPWDQTCAAAAASVDTLQSTVMTRRKRWLILRDRGIWPSAPWRIYAGAGGQRRRDQICMMVQKNKDDSISQALLSNAEFRIFQRGIGKELTEKHKSE